MKLSDLRVNRLEPELCKLEQTTTCTKNEFQRRLREQLVLQNPTTPGGVDINLLLAAMMEKIQVANQTLLTKVQEDSEKQKLS